MKSVFSKNGYNVSIKYNNTFITVRPAAVKKEKDGDIAMVIAIAWAIYRVYMYIHMYDLISWTLAATTHLQTFFYHTPLLYYLCFSHLILWM